MIKEVAFPTYRCAYPGGLLIAYDRAYHGMPPAGKARTKASTAAISLMNNLRSTGEVVYYQQILMGVTMALGFVAFYDRCLL